MQGFAHKIGSVTGPMGLGQEFMMSPVIPALEGTAVAVRALGEKSQYGELELVNGRSAKILSGDVMLGVLGSRKAIKGYVGAVPDRVAVGDKLYLLNRGGVIGRWLGGHSEVGAPLEVEVLGAPVRDGKTLSLRDFGLPWRDDLPAGPPLILVTGTCMQAGKTTVAAALIRWLTGYGLKVHAAKLTGVACRRDLLNMEDHGASLALSFAEAGLPSTSQEQTGLASMAKGVLAALGEGRPDLIVVEMGDGLLGGYGSELILADRQILSRVAFNLLCANDVAGGFGAAGFAREMGLQVDGFSGPATDNLAGTECLMRYTGLPSFNVRDDLAPLGAAVLSKVGAYA